MGLTGFRTGIVNLSEGGGDVNLSVIWGDEALTFRGDVTESVMIGEGGALMGEGDLIPPEFTLPKLFALTPVGGGDTNRSGVTLEEGATDFRGGAVSFSTGGDFACPLIPFPFTPFPLNIATLFAISVEMGRVNKFRFLFAEASKIRMVCFVIPVGGLSLSSIKEINRFGG